MEQNRAVIYARFSSDNQRDESIDAQVRAAEEYAKRNNLHIIKIYTDRAKSATSDKRPEFQQMIADSGKGIFDYVIIHKLDRFSRDKYDSARYKRKLKINGIKLLSVTENLDGSPESIILESMLEGMAEYYSKNLAREVMKGMRENALKCQHTGGRPPLGYDVDPETKRYVINEQEAASVRLIFDYYLEGYGYNRIVSELNGRQLRTKVNRPFGKNSLRDILTNEKYAGTYIFNRSVSKDYNGRRNTHQEKSEEDVIRIPGGVPAIISPEDFQKAQERMRQNKRGPGAYKAKEVYLLSGLIVCGECLRREGREYSMMGNTKFSGRNKLKHVTYRCSNRDRTKMCDNKELRREYIEAFVLNELERNVFNEKAIPFLVQKLNAYQKSKATEQDQELSRKQEALTEVGSQIRNIVDAVTMGCSQMAFVDKLAELESRKASLELAVQEANAKKQNVSITEDALRDMFATFRQFIKEKNIPEIRRFIRSYVHKVIVYKDHCEVVFFLKFDNAPEQEPYHFVRRVSRKRLLRYGRRVA